MCKKICNLTHRKATLKDVPFLVTLLQEDVLGQSRENLSQDAFASYEKAFYDIHRDKNHYLMVVEKGKEIVATSHLTLLSSLTFQGSKRLQIEAVRVSQKYRGQSIGLWMFNEIRTYAKRKHVNIIQLTTHKERSQAISFYENFGFEQTHLGMKLYLS